MRKRGFTLLETIIVLAIMTMFFAISIPLFSKFTEKAKLDTTARSVASALRTARSYAISENVNYYVFFKTPQTPPNRYYISKVDAENEANAIDKVYNLPKGIWFHDPSTGEYDWQSSYGFEFSNNRASFKPTGELDEEESKSVYVADDISTSAESKVITVERTTGRVRIED